MIRKKGDFTLEKRQVANGEGEIIFHHFFNKEEMFGKSRLCAEAVIEPGNSIGLHAHDNDMEIFYMLEGELVSIDAAGNEEPFLPGDVMATGGGAAHSLRNDSGSPARMLAFIAL